MELEKASHVAEGATRASSDANKLAIEASRRRRASPTPEAVEKERAEQQMNNIFEANEGQKGSKDVAPTDNGVLIC